MGNELKEIGPIERLCAEIGFRFDERLETPAMLIAFVAELVEKIGEMRWTAAKLADFGAPPPSEESEIILLSVQKMLSGDIDTIVQKAAEIHDAIHIVNPDEGECDHLIDMLSSCVSAIRFGLEKPCASRHAAEAANHVWSKLYGVTLFDRHTSEWQNSWARSKFEQALIGLMSLHGSKGACAGSERV